MGADDLARVTDPLQPEGKEGSEDVVDDDDEEEDFNARPYDDLLNELDGVETTDDDPGHLPAAFRHFTFETIRNNGRHNCGIDVNLPKLEVNDLCTTNQLA